MVQALIYESITACSLRTGLGLVVTFNHPKLENNMEKTTLLTMVEHLHQGAHLFVAFPSIFSVTEAVQLSQRLDV